MKKDLVYGSSIALLSCEIDLGDGALKDGFEGFGEGVIVEERFGFELFGVGVGVGRSDERVLVWRKRSSSSEHSPGGKGSSIFGGSGG